MVVHNREALKRDVDSLFNALFRTDSARYVQRISIKGALRLKPKDVHKDYQKKAYWTRHGLDEILADEETTDYLGPHTVYDEGVIEKSSEEDMAWTPVVSLLQATPNLKDLVYDCDSQFPPCLLGILHMQHPQCRLHHLTFRFRTLLWGVPKSYEMELATSPSLYRFKLATGPRDTEGDDDFNLEAMMELVSGLAPNLKEVVVVGLVPMLSRRGFRVREPWHGLPGFTGKAAGCLTSLSLHGFHWLETPKQLQAWARHTDFACLQHLTLGGIYEGNRMGLSGETMEWVTQNHSFPHLRTLQIYLTRDDKWHERPRYTENVISFFQSLEPLVELSVHGPIDSQIFDAMLSQHGQTLKKLNLRPDEARWFLNCTMRDLAGNVFSSRNPPDIPFEFTKDRILQIQDHCSVLEELAIPIKRKKSSVLEVETYKCFREMKKLRSLFLSLDCSNWQVARDSTYKPQFSEGDQKPMSNKYRTPYLSVNRGICKETLVNCAVDEKLARSIWNAVSQNKTGRQLGSLKLWTEGGGNYGSPGWQLEDNSILKNLSRSWLIERVPRTDHQDVIVKELAPGAREIEEHAMTSIEKSEALQIFHEIWPSKEGSKDWRDDWSSFPLPV